MPYTDLNKMSATAKSLMQKNDPAQYAKLSASASTSNPTPSPTQPVVAPPKLPTTTPTTTTPPIRNSYTQTSVTPGQAPAQMKTGMDLLEENKKLQANNLTGVNLQAEAQRLQKENGWTYNQALATARAGGGTTPQTGANVSGSTGSSTGIAGQVAGSTMDQAAADLTPGFDKWATENDKLFDIADELKDEKIASYEELHTRQLERLNGLQTMMEELTAQKNSLVAGSANVQNLEIQAAYDANQENLRIAKERLDQTQKLVLAEKEKQTARKTVNEENMLALIGGFGSNAANKQLLDSISEGEDKISALKVEFSLQDQEHTGKVIQLNNDYKNDKLKIEQWKQEEIQQNYENLQNHIASIMESEDKSDQQKVESINAAKDQYNNTISNLHSKVIDARFALSREIIDRSDTLRKEADSKIMQQREMEMQDKQMAREDLSFAREDLAMLSQNYALEDWGSLPKEVKQRFDDLEKQADLPPGFTEITIKNFKAQIEAENKVKPDDLNIRFEDDGKGNVTVIGVDKKTGEVISTTGLGGVGKVTAKEPSNEMEKGFNVGSIGGWCGNYASTVSTAAKVADNWAGKINKVTHRDNPKPGDKLVVPLGVTDAGKDYGHVAAVLSYNPETGDILVTESNKDGRQSRGEGEGVITMGYYNLNEMKAKYGNNFGFISGNLKPSYQKLAEKYGLLDAPGTEASATESQNTEAPATTNTQNNLNPLSGRMGPTLQSQPTAPTTTPTQNNSKPASEAGFSPVF